MVSPFGVDPRALADAVAGVDAGVSHGARGTQVGAPLGLRCARCFGKRRAMGIRAVEAAEVGAIAFARARQEEGHTSAIGRRCSGDHEAEDDNCEPCF